MRSSLVAVSLIAAWTSAARADAPAPPDMSPDGPVVASGIAAGYTHIAHDRFLLFGMSLAAAHPVGPAVLVAEYSYTTADRWTNGYQNITVTGHAHRVGLVAQFEIARGAFLGDSVRAYVEGGVGQRFLSLDTGDDVTRTDLVAGAGIRSTVLLGVPSGTPVFGGVYVSARATAARAPDLSDGGPVCKAVTCPREAPRAGIDPGALVSMGVNLSW